jgi:catechol 2,3-dioxygenase-like lactoylglutathione lyase family enzyme
MSMSYLGLSHVALRVSDLAKARKFYVETLGFQPIQQTDHLILSNVHGSLVGLIGPDPKTPAGDTFNPFRIGLDHIALTVPNRGALEKLKSALDSAGVRNNGIEKDSFAEFITFYDPDGIAWEFYVMPLQIRLVLALSGLLGFKIPPRN